MFSVLTFTSAFAQVNRTRDAIYLMPEKASGYLILDEKKNTDDLLSKLISSFTDSSFCRVT